MQRSSFSTSEPLRMVGRRYARFGYGIRATTSGRFKVTRYKNFTAATQTTCVEGLMPSFSTMWSRNPRTSSSPSFSGDRPG